MKATARRTGTAPTSLLLPTNESTTHSTRRHEVTTETISQSASPLAGPVNEEISRLLISEFITVECAQRPGLAFRYCPPRRQLDCREVAVIFEFCRHCHAVHRSAPHELRPALL